MMTVCAGPRAGDGGYDAARLKTGTAPREVMMPREDAGPRPQRRITNVLVKRLEWGKKMSRIKIHLDKLLKINEQKRSGLDKFMKTKTHLKKDVKNEGSSG